MTNRELAIVLAMARCGLAQEPPTAAFVQQVRRLAATLAPDDAVKFKELLAWHDGGREKCTAEVVLSEQEVENSPGSEEMPAAQGQPDQLLGMLLKSLEEIQAHPRSFWDLVTQIEEIRSASASSSKLLTALQESFEAIQSHPRSFWDCTTEITAIRQALAAPVPANDKITAMLKNGPASLPAQHTVPGSPDLGDAKAAVEQNCKDIPEDEWKRRYAQRLVELGLAPRHAEACAQQWYGRHLWESDDTPEYAAETDLDAAR